MTLSELIKEIFSKKSYLCVGLDTDIGLLPKHLPANINGLLAFNKRIIDATLAHCVAFKINTAFYEQLGAVGWEVMLQTMEYIPPTHLKIADAKRGDIGNTSAMYAKAIFETLKADAVTVSPYMGYDSLAPFLAYQNKWTIVLALTSNTGKEDFQLQKLSNDRYVFEEVLHTCRQWATPENMMFVIGATHKGMLQTVRNIVPHHFLLVPGVGAQGGNLGEVSVEGMHSRCGLLVNSSRNIIYASDGEDFAVKAEEVAKNMASEMKMYLEREVLISGHIV